MSTSFLSEQELAEMGFAHVGEGAQISRKASFYGTSRISIGDHTRIDDFCVLSAGGGQLVIGHHVHIAVYSSLIGAGGFAIGDFTNISSRVALYSSNDDYSGESMTNPTVEDAYKNVTHALLTLGRHVIIGSGAVVLPGLTLGDGACIGALSLVNHDCDPFTVYAGVPARRIKERSKKLLEVEAQRARHLADDAP